MTLVKDLLAKHGANLSSDIKSEAVEYARRAAARASFADPSDMTPLEAQTGFILMEREFSSTPVTLFGQDVKSLAHTKIRVFRARTGSDGKFEPGKEIFAARISEKSLTESMLNTISSEGAALTVTRLGEFDLPDHHDEQTRIERAAEAYAENQAHETSEAILDLKSLLDTGIVRPNGDLRDKASTLGYKIRDMLSTDYALGRHLEAMSILRSEVLTEAAHAALHAQKVSRAMEGGLAALPAPEPMDWDSVAAENPMVDTLLDPLSARLQQAIGQLILHEIEEIGQEYPDVLKWIYEDEGHKRVRFPEQRERSSAIGWRSNGDALKKRLENLSSLSNWAFNPYLAESRQMRRPTQAALNIGQRNGCLGNIHSALPPTEGTYFSICINAAWDDLDHGRGRVRSGSERLVEIEITAEDMMTALRGHPDGLPVPCSLRAVCGIWRPTAERPRHDITTDISNISTEIMNDPQVKDLQNAYARLDELVTAKRSGKKWLEETQQAVDDIEKMLQIARNSVDDGLEKGRQKIDMHVVRSAEQILSSIARSLPAEAMRLLKIGKTDD